MTPAEVVEGIRLDSPEAAEELYSWICALRYGLARDVGWDYTLDAAHDLWLAVARAIKLDAIRDPERLLGYLATIRRRYLAEAYRNRLVRLGYEHLEARGYVPEESAGLESPAARVPDSRPSPEDSWLREEQGQLVERLLRVLGPVDREIIERFYLLEQSPDHIQREMQISDNQFRNNKHRAKRRLTWLAQAQMASRGRRRRK